MLPRRWFSPCGHPSGSPPMPAYRSFIKEAERVTARVRREWNSRAAHRWPRAHWSRDPETGVYRGVERD